MQVTVRKKLPLPVITDTAGVSTPTGRSTNTSGVVRDSVNTLSTIMDYATDYDIDESISGRWRFTTPVVLDAGACQLFNNRTGATRAAGDVVMMDVANDQSVILPDITGTAAQRVGVVAESIAAGAIGRVAFSGYIRIKVAAGTTRGMYLQTQSASVVAAGTTYVLAGSFAIALTAPDGSSTVLAMLRGGGGAGGTAVDNYLVNGGAETWSGPSPVNGNAAGTAVPADGWLAQATGSNALVITRDTTNVDIGSGQCMSCQNTISSGNSFLFQNIPIYAQMRGRTLTTQMRFRAVGAGVTVRLYWNDGVTGGGTDQRSVSLALTAGAYVTQFLTFTPATTASKLTVGVYFETNGTIAVDNCTLCLGSAGVDYAPPSSSVDNLVVLGPGLFATGTAPIPSVSFFTDQNTGLYNSGADELSVATGGTQRLVADANGYIGINTPTPRTRLDVNGLARVGGITPLPASGAGLELQWDGTTSLVNSYDRSASATKPLTLVGSPVNVGLSGAQVVFGTAANSLGAFISMPARTGNQICVYDAGAGSGFGIGVNTSELTLFAGANSVIGFRVGNIGGNRGVTIDPAAGAVTGTTVTATTVQANGAVKAYGGVIQFEASNAVRIDWRSDLAALYIPYGNGIYTTGGRFTGALTVDGVATVGGRLVTGGYDAGWQVNLGMGSTGVITNGRFYQRGSGSYYCWDAGDFTYAVGPTASTLVQRDGSGNIQANSMYMPSAAQGGKPTYVAGQNNDGYLRWWPANSIGPPAGTWLAQANINLPALSNNGASQDASFSAVALSGGFAAAGNIITVPRPGYYSVAGGFNGNNQTGNQETMDVTLISSAHGNLDYVGVPLRISSYFGGYFSWSGFLNAGETIRLNFRTSFDSISGNGEIMVAFLPTADYNN